MANAKANCIIYSKAIAVAYNYIYNNYLLNMPTIYLLRNAMANLGHGRT
jgi:hypothetical protein